MSTTLSVASVAIVSDCWAEGAGVVVAGVAMGFDFDYGRSCVDETKSARKPFDIPKMLIWNAYLKVKDNRVRQVWEGVR
jgi:hypothetical protein